eukprot:TRINITY_DN3936_c0_g1_i1.p1 TRINITY_DN3936_c0_g1~~TRINITY_DN3936_c0_g1_i1.p1  ORF type:complete len:628 (+),score=241.83 TRINITY_DN3936_c0_g1_i1:154-2037(+)
MMALDRNRDGCLCFDECAQLLAKTCENAQKAALKAQSKAAQPELRMDSKQAIKQHTGPWFGGEAPEQQAQQQTETGLWFGGEAPDESTSHGADLYRQYAQDARRRTADPTKQEAMSPEAQTGQTGPWFGGEAPAGEQAQQPPGPVSVVEMSKALIRAQKKFDQLDSDGNGMLQGAELVALADWVWSSFHPGGEALSEEHKEQVGVKLLGRLDQNQDGAMSFDEFGEWFGRTCESISKHRRGLADKAREQQQQQPDSPAPQDDAQDMPSWFSGPKPQQQEEALEHDTQALTQELHSLRSTHAVLESSSAGIAQLLSLERAWSQTLATGLQEAKKQAVPELALTASATSSLSGSKSTRGQSPDSPKSPKPRRWGWFAQEEQPPQQAPEESTEQVHGLQREVLGLQRSLQEAHERSAEIVDCLCAQLADAVDLLSDPKRWADQFRNLTQEEASGVLCDAMARLSCELEATQLALSDKDQDSTTRRNQLKNQLTQIRELKADAAAAADTIARLEGESKKFKILASIDNELLSYGISGALAKVTRKCGDWTSFVMDHAACTQAHCTDCEKAKIMVEALSAVLHAINRQKFVRLCMWRLNATGKQPQFFGHTACQMDSYMSSSPVSSPSLGPV